ncbi:VCBS domain-containing protein [Enterovibrio baiacu]|uniref:VCBS domain-containing protein n=1 Tax=Enterovibrio baiacu TaxID=2491023 RepID=UPI003D0CB418
MPNSVLGLASGNAYIIKADGSIQIASDNPTLSEGDILIPSKTETNNSSSDIENNDNTNEGDLGVVAEGNEDIAVDDLPADVQQIIEALERGEDPLSEEEAAPEAGEGNIGSSITGPPLIEAGSEHVQVVADFALDDSALATDQGGGDDDEISASLRFIPTTDDDTSPLPPPIVTPDQPPVFTGTLTGSVDFIGFDVNPNEGSSLTSPDAAISNGTQTTRTTTTSSVSDLPFVISTTTGGTGGIATISRVNNDGTLTETDRITYDATNNTIISTSAGDLTSAFAAAGVENLALRNLTQSNVFNVDGNETLFLTSHSGSSITTWTISDSGTLSFNGGKSFVNGEDLKRSIGENVVFEGADGTEYILATRPGGDGVSKLTYDPVSGQITNDSYFIDAGDAVSAIDIITLDNYSTFVVTASHENIKTFSVNPNNGELTLVDTQTPALGNTPSVNFYHTPDGRTYAIYANNARESASIYELSDSGTLTLTDTITGNGHYFASAGYIEGQPVYVTANATEGVDLYTISDDGKLIYQSTVTDLENDWTPPVIVQTDDGSYYLVDADSESATAKVSIGDEDVLTVSGSVAFIDPDSTDVPVFNDTIIKGEYGTLTLVSGVWTYTLERDKAQSLDTDEVAQETFTVTATNGVQQNIVIDVTGNKPYVANSVIGNNTDSLALDLSQTTATGSLSIVNADGDMAAVFANTTESGSYGTLTLVNGDWTYTIDPSLLPAIPTGDTLQDSVSLQATDGTKTEVVIVIANSEADINNYYDGLANSGLSDIIDLNSITYVGSDDADLIHGNSGDDVLLGLLGDDIINGGAGNDTIDLGMGDDTVIGGAGNDTLYGGAGEDTFVFELDDVGTAASPAVDTIGDFNTSDDALDLSNLLQNEHEESIGQYLNFIDNGSGNATLQVSSEGNGDVDQQIIFENKSVADFASDYGITITGVAPEQISTAVIDAMIAQSQIMVD